MFAQSLRQDLAMRQVLQGIGGTVVAPKAVVDPSLDALLQRRQVQYQRFDTQAYRAKVNPSEADIEAYYKANEAQFRAPEQARIEYVVLDQQALQKGLTVPEEELKRYYTENADALHRGRRAPRQPHPDQGRQGHGRGRPAEGARQGRCAAGAAAQVAGAVCRTGQARTATIRAAPSAAATSTISAAARWSSPSRTRCSR